MEWFPLVQPLWVHVIFFTHPFILSEIMKKKGLQRTCVPIFNYYNRSKFFKRLINACCLCCTQEYFTHIEKSSLPDKSTKKFSLLLSAYGLWAGNQSLCHICCDTGPWFFWTQRTILFSHTSNVTSKQYEGPVLTWIHTRTILKDAATRHCFILLWKHSNIV